MSREFQVKISASDADSLVEKAKKTAAENDAVIAGDARSGSFQGHGVAGTYRIDEGLVSVTITQKPFIAPWELVESIIRKFFG